MVVPMIAITIVLVIATLFLSKVWVFDTDNLLFKLVLVFGSFIFTWGILWAVFVNVISEFFYYGDRIQNDESELSPSLRWAFSTNPTLVKFICWLLVPGIASAVFSTQIF